MTQTNRLIGLSLAEPKTRTVRSAMWLPCLLGGVLLLLADTLARGVLAPQELPVGVLTAVLGGGYLLWLMHRRAG